ncbi:hypothetical protein M0R04_14625 [Candidatus Dojkabacteria bacterium]|jgi:hypothetical protein|nr:hypothetical protein [Candidatus Dojkabacteria bacterium]
MGTCYKCNVQFTLKNEEMICDNCHELVTYPCNSCHDWFSIADDNGKKIKECLVCGYFICPYCESCGEKCKKKDWIEFITRVIDSDKSTDLKAKQLANFIEELKLSKEQKLCPKKVPISYAKSRIKGCLARMKGYNIKGEIDQAKFAERLDKIFHIPIGETFTVSDKREEGSYGQEYRDVINTAICYGKVKAEWMKRKDDKTEYLLYTRIEGSPCKMLDAENLLFKRCRRCKKDYSLQQEYCSDCIRKQGALKGYALPLILKVSNKDTCQLNRGAFHGRRNKKVSEAS